MRRLQRSNRLICVRWSRLTAVLLLFAFAAAIAVIAVTDREVAAQAAPGDSTCIARAWGTPLTRWAALGEEVQVRTMIGWSCPERTQPYDLAMVIDAPTLVGDDAAMARYDLTELVRRIDLVANRYVRLGLVGFGDEATWLAALGSPPERHLGAIRSLAAPERAVPTGSGGLAAGVREGLKMLAIGKRPPAGGETRDPARQGMVVLALPRDDDYSVDYCAGLGAELQQAERDDVDVTLVCMNGDCEPSCLDAFNIRMLSQYAWDIMALEQERLAWQSELRVEFLDLREQLHESLAIVEGSVDSRAGSYDLENHGIRWRLDVRHNDDGRMLLAYSVRPQKVGRFPVRKKVSSGLLRDTRGQTRGFALPLFDIVVTKGRVFNSYLPWLNQRIPVPAPTPPDHTFQP